jgi:hypothetical protein
MNSFKPDSSFSEATPPDFESGSLSAFSRPFVEKLRIVTYNENEMNASSERTE